MSDESDGLGGGSAWYDAWETQVNPVSTMDSEQHKSDGPDKLVSPWGGGCSSQMRLDHQIKSHSCTFCRWQPALADFSGWQVKAPDARGSRRQQSCSGAFSACCDVSERARKQTAWYHRHAVL